MSLLEEKKSVQINWYLWCGIGLLVVLVSFAAWSIYTKPDINNTTLCEVGVLHKATVVLFDKTGGFSPNQKRTLTKAVEAEVGELKMGERLTVFEVDDTEYKGLSKPIFDSCRPKSKAEANEFTENPEMIAKQFNNDFMGKLRLILNELEGKGDATNSPLIESLSDIAILYNIDKGLKIKKLLIVSDLLQHSPDFSAYNNTLKTVAPEKLSLLPDLFGVDVQVYWLLRDKKEQQIQNKGLLPWWERVFEATTVKNLSVMKVR
jgi:hypothetical protein